MRITNFCEISLKYRVRRLTLQDIDGIYELSIGNPLFYKYCPPYVTRDSILSDMNAEQRFYVNGKRNRP